MQENKKHNQFVSQLIRYCSRLRQLGQTFLEEPKLTRHLLNLIPAFVNGSVYSRDWNSDSTDTCQNSVKSSHGKSIESTNPLKLYIDSHKEGKGVHKSSNYFDIYHTHFDVFRGRDVHVLEIGVHSGGSLEMWHDYFGSKCHVYGIDVHPACKAHEDDRTKIFIGDQGDRAFWKDFKDKVPTIDIVIDDGGHLPEQQVVTLEEMLPHIRPGGVYLCEDILSDHFTAFLFGLMNALNVINRNEDSTASKATHFQSSINSVHLYPFVAVIQKNDRHINEFSSVRGGTEWLPY